MTDGLLVPVDDLVGSHRVRRFSGVGETHLKLGDAVIDGPMTVSGVVQGQLDLVKVSFEVSAETHLVCVRCLTEWDEEVTVGSDQYFAAMPDEDGYGIEDGSVDLSGPATDELALALPAAPVCKPDCLGLCPTCGTDLNSEPCDGHRDDSDSPFTVLKDLFDS